MAKKTSPLLTLSTDIVRDYILIDGQECPIKGYQELSIVDLHWLKHRFSKVHKLFSQDELSEDEINNMQETIDEFVKFIFTEPPEELLAKITHGHKYEIMMAFTQLFLDNLPGRAKELIEETLQETEQEPILKIQEPPKKAGKP